MSVLSTPNPAAYRTLTATIATAFGLQVSQAACAAVAIPLQTEKFYDLSGAFTFISCTLVSLYYPAYRAKLPLPNILSFHPRQLVMSGFTVLWAGRLGSFLFGRIKKAGSDPRFDEIKKKPASFAGAWFLQGVWVSLTALPVYAVNAIPRSAQPALGPRDGLAAALWLGAFAFEVIADRQKSEWGGGKRQRFTTRSLSLEASGASRATQTTLVKSPCGVPTSSPPRERSRPPSSRDVSSRRGWHTRPSHRPCSSTASFGSFLEFHSSRRPGTRSLGRAKSGRSTRGRHRSSSRSSGNET